jgi:hypothetical protein
MEVREMKIGIIGYGNWGKKLFNEYSNLIGKENVIIYDPLQGYRKPLEDVDGVHIATPPHSHYSIAKEFINKGIPVLVEKPMCRSSKECLLLTDLARKKKVPLMVGHIFRYSNAFRNIGPIHPKKSIKFIWKHVSSAASPLWDLLPHIFDMCNYITGEWPERLKAVHNKRNAFVIGYLCNIPLSIELSLNYKGKIRDLVVDDNIYHLLSEQTNNSMKTEILEFVHRINHQAHIQSTDGFLGYMTVKLIEDVTYP